MSSQRAWHPSEGIARDFDRIDMYVTAFSILRDRYRRWDFFVSLFLMAAGVGLVLLTFGSEEVLALLSISATAAPVITGVLGAIVFIASLVEIRVNWQGDASLYAWAADRFAELKLEYGSYVDGPGKDDVREAELRGRYQSASAVAPRLPEDQFLPLKQAHLRKVALSRMVSQSPGTPLAVHRWRLMRRGKVEK